MKRERAGGSARGSGWVRERENTRESGRERERGREGLQAKALHGKGNGISWMAVGRVLWPLDTSQATRCPPSARHPLHNCRPARELCVARTLDSRGWDGGHCGACTQGDKMCSHMTMTAPSLKELKGMRDVVGR